MPAAGRYAWHFRVPRSAASECTRDLKGAATQLQELHTRYDRISYCDFVDSTAVLPVILRDLTFWVTAAPVRAVSTSSPKSSALQLWLTSGTGRRVANAYSTEIRIGD